MKFVKMHGIGNDFVVIDASKMEIERPDRLARKLCDRRFGIGGDGLILVLPSAKGDFRMRMWNPDGSEAEMCGNGIRCLGKFVVDHGLKRQKKLNIETLAGMIGVRVITATNKKVLQVQVDMGTPRRLRSEIPMKGPEGPVVEEALKVDGRNYAVTCVSMGNPHCVVFVDNVACFPVEKVGPLIENHEAFPHRTNVEFVQVVKRDEVIQRTWERGAGETLACGTGACAAVVAGVLTERTDRVVRNHLKGGDLVIEWAEGHDRVFMTGQAEEVYAGDWPEPPVDGRRRRN